MGNEDTSCVLRGPNWGRKGKGNPCNLGGGVDQSSQHDRGTRRRRGSHRTGNVPEQAYGEDGGDDDNKSHEVQRQEQHCRETASGQDDQDKEEHHRHEHIGRRMAKIEDADDCEQVAKYFRKQVSSMMSFKQFPKIAKTTEIFELLSTLQSICQFLQGQYGHPRRGSRLMKMMADDMRRPERH
mmetsp:Transcript_104335/g.238936  ORF Transcript_104335/g.238936 Transcript_104335/m.238936 type:complete len:183 (+) Transcript_104335:460-1008(+)